MFYRLPELNDEEAVRDYLRECFDNKETEVVIGQELLPEEYSKWAKMMQDHAVTGNGEWGRSLLLLCFSKRMLVGFLCIRYELSKELESLYGNIGYNVRPSERKKGYATRMLLHALSICREKGMNRVILGCYSDNIASVSIIESCGGDLVNTVKESENVTNCYYEIAL